MKIQPKESAISPTELSRSTLPITALPSATVKFPPGKKTFPPIKARVLASSTSKPTGRSLRSTVKRSGSIVKLFPVPRTIIFPGLLPYCKPTGILTVSNGVAPGLAALNPLPSANSILSAVVLINEPPRSSAAFSPNTIPLGLIKNKSAVPLARNKPSISEMLPPVTRLMMFSIVVALLKKTVSPVPTENSSKL